MRISDWSSDVCPSDLAEPGLERVEGEPLRAPGRLANLAHVGHVQVDQVAEGRRLGLAALQGRLAKIDPALSRGGPPAPVLAPQEGLARVRRSEEHTSELQSLMRSSYAVFCLKKKT